MAATRALPSPWPGRHYKNQEITLRADPCLLMLYTQVTNTPKCKTQQSIPELVWIPHFQAL